MSSTVVVEVARKRFLFDLPVPVLVHRHHVEDMADCGYGPRGLNGADVCGLVMRGSGRWCCRVDAFGEAASAAYTQEAPEADIDRANTATWGIVIRPGIPYRIRTGVTAVKGQRPRPLDERDSVGVRNGWLACGQVVGQAR